MKDCEEPKIGGNCLKNTFTRRHNRDEYFVKSDEVIKRLIEYGYSDLNVRLIESYKTKETFGDTDIIYTSSFPFTVEWINFVFMPNEIVKNGPVISFDYKELQVDLIYSSNDEYDYAFNYFSGNDLGNLIGRLAKKFDLKHGHAGLLLPVKDGDYGIAELVVTQDHDETLRFLGLDVDRFHQGFDTLEDIFQYVASSPYFNPEIYLFENVNAVSRIRDKKRKTYNAFLEWCKVNDATLPKNPAIERWRGRQMVFEYFGDDIRKKYNDALAKVAFNRAVKEKFNGDLVSQLTLSTGKELGETMVKLKGHPFFTPDNLFTASHEDIAKMICEVYHG